MFAKVTDAHVSQINNVGFIYDKTAQAYEDIFKTMLLAREAEHREAILFRQGKGLFHLPGAGHEAVALLAKHIDRDDRIFPHYRDKALMLALGVPLYQLALDYFGKADSSSGGTQMSSHFYAPDYNVASCATPTALQALPAAGAAWAKKLKHSDSISVCITGEASIRQGEWMESLTFALQESLPLVLMVEDNGYGVSTPTGKMVSPVLEMLPKDRVHVVQSHDIGNTDQCFQAAIGNAREGMGLQIIWMHCPRIMSHTSSDDQHKYRNQAELESLHQMDPLHALEILISETNSHMAEKIIGIKDDVKEEVKEIYRQASLADAPDITVMSGYTLGKETNAQCSALPLRGTWHMVDAVNHTLHQLMQENEEIIILGEDVEDPKGGVFGMTRNLSEAYPQRVYNAPLAEATIAGVASGVAIEGMLPVFELQFADFSGPAINQMMNQIATLRWRTAGKEAMPMVFLAPCGGYISGGGAWHSQTLEALFAQMPGLRVVMPSNPQQAANALQKAVAGEDPVIILLPKHQFFRTRSAEEMPTHELISKGDDVTIVSWGNGVHLCEEAAKHLQSKDTLTCDVIGLQSLSPLDISEIKCSVKKTGRLLIVQESTRHCSLGQAIIADLLGDTDTWDNLFAPPQLVSRDNIHVPFHYETSLCVLPSVEDICNAIGRLISL